MTNVGIRNRNIQPSPFASPKKQSNHPRAPSPRNPNTKNSTMASAKSFALKALRSNVAGQTFRRTATAQFQNSLVKAQPFQRTAPRPAFVPVRWHSIPASARSKDYDFTQVKEFATSPSEDRLLIGTSPFPFHSRTKHTNSPTHRCPRTLRVRSRLHSRRDQYPREVPT